MAFVKHRIKTPEDLAWLIEHTHGFQAGQVLELHVRKQRVFDEVSGRDVGAGAVVAASIRYDRALRGAKGLYAVTRVAKLTMTGVTDFSIFEQEGADFSEIGEAHAEASEGRLRFWFDPCGELYVICDEAELEEVSRPGSDGPHRAGMTEWTFQADVGDLPAVGWFLDRLDQLGLPCAWREIKGQGRGHPARRWEGRLLPASSTESLRNAGVHVATYGPLDGDGFGVTLRVTNPHEPMTGRLLVVLADMIARSFSGLCLAGDHILERDEWLGGQILGRETRSDT
jgi:hypothetical protein